MGGAILGFHLGYLGHNLQDTEKNQAALYK